MNIVAEAISVLFIIFAMATAAFICRRIAQDPVADPFGASVEWGQQYGRLAASHPRQRYFRGEG